jgi:uncharacterized protein YjiS (DUF1127 family)
MPFSKSFSQPLPFTPSSSRRPALRPTDRYVAVAGNRGLDDDAQETLVAFPRQAPPRRSISAIASRLFAEGFVRSAHALHAVPTLPIAIVSWLATEFFAGCAAYAQAMYPVFPLEDEAADPPGRVAAAAAGQGDAPRSRPVLRLVPMTPSSESDGAVAVGTRDQPSLDSSLRIGSLSQAEPMRADHAGRRPSVAVAAMSLVSRLRAARAQRRTTNVLQHLDDRTLRDLGICRGDIETAGRESRWE